jgi:hypothetical protein
MLVARDPAAAMLAARLLMRRLGSAAGGPTFAMAEREVRVVIDAHHDASLTAGGDSAATSADSCVARVTVEAGYAPCGALLLDASRTCAHLDDAVQAALVELAKEASMQTQICLRTGARRRRVVLLHGVCRLARPLQCALRKVVESSWQTALFIMTARSVSAVDAPLLWRAAVLNCARDEDGRGGATSTDAATTTGGGAPLSAELVAAAAAAAPAGQLSRHLASAGRAGGRAAQLEFLRAVCRARFCGSAADVAAAARCDHLACLAGGDADAALQLLLALSAAKGGQAT